MHCWVSGFTRATHTGKLRIQAILGSGKAGEGFQGNDEQCGDGE